MYERVNLSLMLYLLNCGVGNTGEGQGATADFRHS